MYEKSTIILSLAIHLVVFEIIILTFTLKPVAHKPIFIFLGSILEEEETTPIAVQARKSSPNPTLRKALIHSPSSFLPNSSTSMLKPFYSEIIPKDNKSCQKSSFLNDDDFDQHKLLLKKLGIATTPPVYMPLRLDAQ